MSSYGNYLPVALNIVNRKCHPYEYKRLSKVWRQWSSTKRTPRPCLCQGHLSVAGPEPRTWLRPGRVSSLRVVQKLLQSPAAQSSLPYLDSSKPLSLTFHRNYSFIFKLSPSDILKIASDGTMKPRAVYYLIARIDEFVSLFTVQSFFSGLMQRSDGCLENRNALAGGGHFSFKVQSHSLILNMTIKTTFEITKTCKWWLKW